MAALRALVVVLPLLGLGLVPAEDPPGPVAAGGGFRGTIRNDEEPFLIRADHGPVYRCRWYGGSTLWFLGDRVQVDEVFGRFLPYERHRDGHLVHGDLERHGLRLPRRLADRQQERCSWPTPSISMLQSASVWARGLRRAPEGGRAHTNCHARPP